MEIERERESGMGVYGADQCLYAASSATQPSPPPADTGESWKQHHRKVHVEAGQLPWHLAEREGMPTWRGFKNYAILGGAGRGVSDHELNVVGMYICSR